MIKYFFPTTETQPKPLLKQVTVLGITYKIVKLISEGGFAYVYQVKTSSDKHFALKHIAETSSDYTVKNELAIWAQLDHQNLCKMVASEGRDVVCELGKGTLVDYM